MGKKKEITCNISVKYMQVPPEKRAAYYRAWDIIADILLDDLAKNPPVTAGKKAADSNTPAESIE